jgi:hypothetical protein
MKTCPDCNLLLPVASFAKGIKRDKMMVTE